MGSCMREDEFEYGGETYEVQRYDDGRWDCPFCDPRVVFDDESALTHHFSNKHGMSAKERKLCQRDECDETWVGYGHRTDYCSLSCMSIDTQADRLVKNCPECGDEFTTPPSKDSKFCGRECYDEYQRAERKTVICQNCKDRFEVRVSEDRKFCSIHCSRNYGRTQRHEDESSDTSPFQL